LFPVVNRKRYWLVAPALRSRASTDTRLRPLFHEMESTRVG
jgi:hypothetical protein